MNSQGLHSFKTDKIPALKRRNEHKIPPISWFCFCFLFYWYLLGKSVFSNREYWVYQPQFREGLIFKSSWPAQKGLPDSFCAFAFALFLLVCCFALVFYVVVVLVLVVLAYWVFFLICLFACFDFSLFPWGFFFFGFWFFLFREITCSWVDKSEEDLGRGSGERERIWSKHIAWKN